MGTHAQWHSTSEAEEDSGSESMQGQLRNLCAAFERDIRDERSG